MSDKLFSIKYNGSFEFIPEEKLLTEIKKSHTWFTNTSVGKVFTLIFALIDFSGFYHLAINSINQYTLLSVVLISAFLVAFELAPLYCGYAICLKSYNLGKNIRDKVYKLSLAAFILGIVSNIVYRILTLNRSVENLQTEIAVMIIMIILPIITSLMSLVIGCLMFDPLMFELNKVAKKINRLNIAKRKLVSAIMEYDDITENKNNEYLENEKNLFASKMQVLEMKRKELCDYIDYKVSLYKK